MTEGVFDLGPPHSGLACRLVVSIYSVQKRHVVCCGLSLVDGRVQRRMLDAELDLSGA